MSDNVVYLNPKRSKPKKSKTLNTADGLNELFLELRDFIFGDNYNEEICWHWFSVYTDVLHCMMFYKKDQENAFAAISEYIAELAPPNVKKLIKRLPYITFSKEEV